MKAKYKDFEGLRWEVMDVREMRGVGDGEFGVAIDKVYFCFPAYCLKGMMANEGERRQGTLDAMISGSLWDPPEEVRRNTKAYIDEVGPRMCLGM